MGVLSIAGGSYVAAIASRVLSAGLHIENLACFDFSCWHIDLFH